MASECSSTTKLETNHENMICGKFASCTFYSSKYVEIPGVYLKVREEKSTFLVFHVKSSHSLVFWYE